MTPEQLPLPGVQTPAGERSEPGPGETLCRCGCGHLVPPERKWAGSLCRQRYWNATHTTLNLAGLSEAERVRAERMLTEALRAAKLGQRRATVDADREVSHEAAVERPDRRNSNRVRLTDDAWDDLDLLRIVYGLPSRSAVVTKLTRDAVAGAVRLLGNLKAHTERKSP